MIFDGILWKLGSLSYELSNQIQGYHRGAVGWLDGSVRRSIKLLSHGPVPLRSVRPILALGKVCSVLAIRNRGRLGYRRQLAWAGEKAGLPVESKRPRKAPLEQHLVLYR